MSRRRDSLSPPSRNQALQPDPFRRPTLIRDTVQRHQATMFTPPGAGQWLQEPPKALSLAARAVQRFQEAKTPAEREEDALRQAELARRRDRDRDHGMER